MSVATKSSRTLARELFGEVPKAKRLFSFALLMSLLTSLSAVTLMGASGYLLSRAAEHPPVLYLQITIVLVRACGLSRACFRYVERLVGHNLALRMQSALRIRAYAKLAATTLLGRRRGDLLVRVVNDVTAIQDLVVRVALPFASAGLLTLGVSAVIATLSVPSSIALLISAVVAGGIVPVLARLASRRADAETIPARGELADRVRELNRAAYDLAAYGDRTRHAALVDVDARIRGAELRVSVIRGFANATQVLAAGFAVIVALAAGIPAVVSGELPRVFLAVIVLVPLALHEVLSTLTQSAQTFTRAQTALGRVAQVLDAPPVGRGDRSGQTTSNRPGMQLTEVSVGWPGGAPVLTGLSLEVRPGERVALVGPSGIGKTTVAATLMELIPPLSGDVRLDGTVGYLAQDAHIFNTTVAENVKIGNRDAGSTDITAALERAGLDQEPAAGTHLQLSPGRIVGEEGSMLSGGEARRLALARVLIGDHQCWILDEPTEHLDQETAEALMVDIWRASEGAPVLVITHDQRVIDDCDRVIRLAPGQ